MLLDSHGGGVGDPGEGEYIQSVEEDHQDWEDGVSSLRSVIPLQSLTSVGLLPSYWTPVLISLALVCLGRGGPGCFGMKSVSVFSLQDLQETFSWLV